MKRAMLKRTDRNSPEYVVLHAHWRKKHGRRPSLSFGGEKNPQKALKIASDLCRQKSEQRSCAKENNKTPTCKHGIIGYCGLCAKENDKTPACKHGVVGYCGFCAKENNKTPACKHGIVGYCKRCVTESQKEF